MAAESCGRSGVVGKSQPDLVGVSVVDDGHMLLVFETGERRLFDLAPFIARGGAYGLLADRAYLERVSIVDCGLALGWPDGQEVYPEALFDCSVPVGA